MCPLSERELVREIDTEPLTAGGVILALFDVANELTPSDERVVPGHPDIDIAAMDVTAREGLVKITEAPLELQVIMLPAFADAMKWRYKQLGYSVEATEDDDIIRIWKD